MSRVALIFDTAEISDAILSSPGWVRVGITAPSSRLREAAASELANTIAARLSGAPEPADERQFPLGL